MTYHFVLPIEPRAQKRDRITARGGFARSYKHPEQRLYESKLRALIEQGKPPKPLEGALRLTIECNMPVPLSWSRKKREGALSHEIRPTGKPDASNLLKNIEDVFNDLVWHDDAQVVTLMVTKWYSESPRWVVEVEEVK